MKLLYALLYAVWWLLSLLPMRVHYVLSDALFLLVYHVLRYRRPLVRRHLADCFPEKTAEERLEIERGFYHWFGDYIAETVKLLTISHSNLKRRMVFKGSELIDEAIESGQSCAIYLGHYCNWEWVTSLPLWVTPKAQCGQIYHVLENKEFDRLFLRLRQRLGAVSIPMAETLRRLATYRQQNQPVVIGYISDQVPFWNNIHHWCPFLNHDTPVFTNGEKIIRKMNNAVFYVDMERPARGKYVVTFKLITLTPGELEENAITRQFFAMLEETIRREPHLYLWSHNRWKRTHEEFDRLFKVVNGKVLPREE